MVEPHLENFENLLSVEAKLDPQLDQKFLGSCILLSVSPDGHKDPEEFPYVCLCCPFVSINSQQGLEEIPSCAFLA